MTTPGAPCRASAANVRKACLPGSYGYVIRFTPNQPVAKECLMKLRKFTILAAASLPLFFANAASFGSNGRENLLDNVLKIKAGVTTAQQARELLGPPGNTMNFPALILRT